MKISNRKLIIRIDFFFFFSFHQAMNEKTKDATGHECATCIMQSTFQFFHSQPEEKKKKSILTIITLSTGTDSLVQTV